MAKVITAIALVDESAEAEENYALKYGKGKFKTLAMSPREIVNALKQIDPDDLQDVVDELHLEVYGRRP